jgi:hypothetical protein
MVLKSMLLVGVAVVGTACIAVQAGAGTRAATHLAGSYTVDAKAKVKNACKPISRANQAVLTCTVSGFTLVYSGTLNGRGVNTFRWIVNCATGKSYTDGTEKFTGFVDGIGSGTFTWGVRSRGTFDCKKGEVTSVSATQNLYSGSGALAGMYGSIHRGSEQYEGVLSS